MTKTITVNGVTIHNTPVDNDLLPLDVANEVNLIVGYTHLYSLKEFDYNQNFLTKASAVEGDCPHCQGSKEIGINQLETNEIALVPCVCSEDHVVGNLSDVLTTPTETQEPLNNHVDPSNVNTPTIMVMQPNLEGVPETIGDTVYTQISNQVAMLKLMGYDLQDIAQGFPAKAYQFVVVGQHESSEIFDHFLANPLVSGRDLHAFVCASDISADMTEAEIELPRVRSREELVAARISKDLRQVQNINEVMNTVASDMLNRVELSSTAIASNPGVFSTEVILLKNLVRTLVSQAQQQNSRYDVINPQSRSRIATAYYLHAETNQYYMFTLDFEAGSVEPTDYMITKLQHRPTERVVTTADLINAINTILNDLSEV